MISLCTDYNLILSSLNTCIKQNYISEIIRLYLESYGCDYPFQEFYVQKICNSNEISAVILRCDNQFYLAASNVYDADELYSFIRGFADCCLISDKIFLLSDSSAEICYIMSKNGNKCNDESSDVRSIKECKEIADLVGTELPYSERLNYFLNLSHQVRHEKVGIFAYYVDFVPVSAVVLSTNSEYLSIITTVYTHKHFRGNGYAKVLLNKICCDSNVEYQLICEEHNVKFYEKCGFSVKDTCLKFRL